MSRTELENLKSIAHNFRKRTMHKTKWFVSIIQPIKYEPAFTINSPSTSENIQENWTSITKNAVGVDAVHYVPEKRS